MFPVKSCFCSAAWYKYRAHIESERQVEKEEASGNKWKALEDEVDSFKKQKKSMQLRKTSGSIIWNVLDFLWVTEWEPWFGHITKILNFVHFSLALWSVQLAKQFYNVHKINL